MGQVLLNLVVDARDAMPNGGTLWVDIGSLDLAEAGPDRPASLVPGRYVTLTVTDTGAGIDAETRAHLFEPPPHVEAVGSDRHFRDPPSRGYGRDAMDHSATDEALLHEAIELARERMKSGAGGPFGAIVARDGWPIARGWNGVTTLLDPTAHAEVVAIRRACNLLGTFRLDGCTLYTSCEPCPMCLAAAYWARISRIVFGAGRADAAAAGFDDAFIYDEIGLPYEARSVRMSQLLRDEATVPFREWLEKDDRVPY